MFVLVLDGLVENTSILGYQFNRVIISPITGAQKVILASKRMLLHCTQIFVKFYQQSSDLCSKLDSLQNNSKFGSKVFKNIIIYTIMTERAMPIVCCNKFSSQEEGKGRAKLLPAK